MPATVSFTRMDQSRAEDWALVMDSERAYHAGLADRVLEIFRRCDGIAFAHPVSSMVHGLQTATRALRDGADDEMITVALLHDVGEVIDADNHGALTAALLGPYVSEENAWLIRHHGLFQGYYYLHLVGGDRNARDRYRGHPCFQRTVDFCEKWDQRSFDPAYGTLPLAAFEPAVRRVLGRPHRVDA
jgi:predicted HD phosphohydrolase